MSGGFRLQAAVILIGFTAAIAQIVLVRELMVVFNGNEISIGLMLASWLLWTAAGSIFGARFPLPALEILLAIALPATVLAIRASRGALASVSGESLGPGTMLLVSLAALSVVCAASGALFTAGTKLWARSRELADSTAVVYLYEGVGSAAGGLLAGLALHWFGSMELVLLLSMANVTSAVALTRPAAAPLAALCAVLLLPGTAARLESWSLERFWRGFRVIAASNSAYGNLAVIETGQSRSVYENGVALFNIPDRATAEEAVHYALLEHAAPRTLLLIGGGVSGSLAEALEHHTLERVDYVELDPAILDLARRYFPNEWKPVEADPRVHVHATDGRLFLKNTPLRFDVIIVDAPDPQTAQLNRFYTVEFFREAAARLSDTGLLSFQLTASENYISPELAAFLRSVNKTLRTVFPQVATIPGDTVHFFAALRPGVLAANSDELLARLRTRGIETQYVREYYIPFRMTPDRIAELDAQIRPGADTPVNRDFAPIAYYFDVALWSSRFHHGYRDFFNALAAVRFPLLAAAIAALLIVSVAVVKQPRSIAACATAATGFTMIGCEMLLLVAFQAVYGCIYSQLALVIGGFMAGMALGSWTALRRRGKALAVIQAAVAVSPLVLCALFGLVPRVPFPVLALAAGFLGGFEFPVASRIFFGRRTGANVGALYALDLAGSCIAALLFGTWLIPVFGLFRAAVITALIGLAPAFMAVRLSHFPHKR